MFLQPDGFSIMVSEEFEGMKESFIYSSSIVNKTKRTENCVRKGLWLSLLLMCGDIESCPGPTYEDLKNFTTMKKVLHLNIRGIHNNFANFTSIFNTGRKY